MRFIQWLLLLVVLFSLPACVPVVVVGAAGGGKVLVDRGEHASDEVPSQTIDLIKDRQEVTSSKVDLSSDVELQAIAPTKDLAIAQAVAPDSSSVNESQEQKQPKVAQSSLGAPSQTPAETRLEVSVLIDRGWKVDLRDADNTNSLGGILYFDNQQNFYGFDGCRYFKGKYQADSSGHFMINSLVVSSKGTSNCGNEMTKNLFFVDSFRPHNGAVALYAKDVVAMTLSVQENFDAKDFLNKAKFKNSRSRRR